MPPAGDLDWQHDGRDWPLREASHFVDANDVRWHVQRMGQGPVLLLLHGTGAATHSWRALAPMLAGAFTVIAPDLPGHGFSRQLRAQPMTLPGVARRIHGLLQVLDAMPAVVLGHSAGAAIALRMTLDRWIAPQIVFSLNGALLPFGGLPGQLFSAAARVFAASSVIPRLFAWRAGDPAAVERLLRSTGSTLDSHGAALYARLMRSATHAAAALDMMAHWDLHGLARELPRLSTKLVLITGERDRMVAPAQADRVAACTPGAAVIHLPRLGHLAHEEEPATMAAIVRREWDTTSSSDP